MTKSLLRRVTVTPEINRGRAIQGHSRQACGFPNYVNHAKYRIYLQTGQTDLPSWFFGIIQGASQGHSTQAIRLPEIRQLCKNLEYTSKLVKQTFHPGFIGTFKEQARVTLRKS
eukprot:6191388-Pleurochrysis_carterae.AAC.2